jgi:hypothetical protein
MKIVNIVATTINSKATHTGNSGTEGDGVKLGKGLWFG